MAALPAFPIDLICADGAHADLALFALSLLDRALVPDAWRHPLADAVAGASPQPEEAHRLRGVAESAYRRLTGFETAWPQPPVDRQAWWDYAAARACTALHDGDWTAAARAGADLFGLTGPDQDRAAGWLDALAAAPGRPPIPAGRPAPPAERPEAR